MNLSLIRGLRLTLLHSLDNNEFLFDFEDVKKLEEICIENSTSFQEIDHTFIKGKPSISVKQILIKKYYFINYSKGDS